MAVRLFCADAVTLDKALVKSAIKHTETRAHSPILQPIFSRYCVIILKVIFKKYFKASAAIR
jgi:hypothetical protein